MDNILTKNYKELKNYIFVKNNDYITFINKLLIDSTFMLPKL